MEKWLWLVQQESNDPAKETEFEDWLDNVHIPDTLKFPGIVRATLYVNRGRIGPPDTGWAEGQAKNLAVYEIETEDMKKTWELIRQHIEERQKREGRHPLHKVVSRSMWQQVSPSKEAPPGN